MQFPAGNQRIIPIPMSKSKYLELCARLDAINKKEDPCHFVDGKCVISRNGHLEGDYDSCCRKCGYLNGKGCRKSVIGCKLWWCLYAWNRISPKSRKEIEAIRAEAIAHGFSGIVGECSFYVFRFKMLTGSFPC